MKIITLSGCARHGKDTAANFLKEALESHGKSVMITHYADLLKYICVHFFAWDGQKDEDGRSLLQHVGTDIVRNQRPDYWVEFIANFLELFPSEWDYVIIGDARFPNEISKLIERGFDVTHARVIRPGFENSLTDEQRNHPSETALDNYPVDKWLINNNLDNFKAEVISFANELIAKPRSKTSPYQISIFDGYPYTEGA